MSTGPHAASARCCTHVSEPSSQSLSLLAFILALRRERTVLKTKTKPTTTKTTKIKAPQITISVRSSFSEDNLYGLSTI